MRSAVMVPSFSTAASRSVTCARPWVVEVMCSLRVSVHRTGIRCRWAMTARVTSSGYSPNLTPKPPPTSGAMTRTMLWDRPRVAAMSFRSIWGAWWVSHTTIPLVRGSGAARAARGSIVMPASRWLTIRCFTTRCARANAASGSPALTSLTCSMLPLASSKSRGAPGAIASKASATAGRGSQSTTTSAAASTATASETATTAATASPT